MKKSKVVVLWAAVVLVAATATTCADPTNVNNVYSWSTSGTDPDGTLFTDFLAKMNCTVLQFTGRCGPGLYRDWRIPTLSEPRLPSPGTGTRSPLSPSGTALRAPSRRGRRGACPRVGSNEEGVDVQHVVDVANGSGAPAGPMLAAGRRAPCARGCPPPASPGTDRLHRRPRDRGGRCRGGAGAPDGGPRPGP
jgi:hypothetical protein